MTYTPSQEKFLRTLAALNDQWNRQDDESQLSSELDAFAEEHGVRIRHQRIGRAFGCYLVSADDLARIAALDPKDIPPYGKMPR